MQIKNLMTGNTGTMNTPEELLQAYTSLFLFLGGAVSMSPVDCVLLYLFDPAIVRNLFVDSNISRFDTASRLLRSPCPFKQQCHLSVGDNYRSLLTGSENAEAYPAASHWIRTGYSIEEHHAELGNLYSRYGYSRAEEGGLTADHLGIQLLFANLMIEKYLTEDDYEIRAMIGRNLLGFIKNEMLSWLPRWAEAVSGSSKTKCYTGISGLIVGGLEDVCDILQGQKLGL